jgi:hypothetical protein
MIRIRWIRTIITWPAFMINWIRILTIFSKNQRKLRKKVQYFIKFYDILVPNIFFFNGPKNVHVWSGSVPKLASWIRNSGLRIHGSGPEINIYGSGTTVKTLIK